MGELRVPPQEELMAFIEHQEQWLAGRTFNVPPENDREFRVVFGVCAQAIRYAGGYVAMVRAGRPREAVALARQALEHAGTAMWAHFIDGGVDKLFTTIKATHFDFFQKMSVFLDNDELRREIKDRVADFEQRGTGLPRVIDRLAAIDQRATLQTIYMQQSQFVHVTGSAVLGFISATADGGFGLDWDPPDPHGVNTAYAAAMATMFASWQIAFVGGDSVKLGELDKLSDELLLPLNADPSNAATQV